MTTPGAPVPVTPLLRLYVGLTTLAAPLAPLLVAARARRGKEDPARGGERLGRDARDRPPGPLVWVHAASVGELLSALPLVRALCDRGFALLVTSGTLTSARIARERLPAGAIHAVVPFDSPVFVGRFLRHWRPDLALFVESELWPATVLAVHAARIPMARINARMSPRSARRWRHVGGSIAALLGRFDLTLAQSRGDAERLSALGAAPVIDTGNLKLDADAPEADVGSLADLRAAISGRPVLVAASTHPDEERSVIEADRLLRPGHPDLLTIIVPRHPERGDEVAALMAGRPVRRRSRGEMPDRATALYLVDTLGELGVMLRVATLAFVGGSLVRRGGHNPVEAIKLDVPILHGPDTSSFADAYGALDRLGGACEVAGAEALAAAAARLLGDAEARRHMNRQARAVVDDLSGALGRTLAALAPLLPASA